MFSPKLSQQVLCGDIIQAVQALKESKPEPTGELEIPLVDLWSSLKELPAYCNDVRPESLTYPSPGLRCKSGTLYAASRSLSFPAAPQGPVAVALPCPAWGTSTAEEQRTALARLIESGLAAANMAGHYVYAATKWYMFGPVGHLITTECVLAQVKERCRRFGGQVKLPQFHWSDQSLVGGVIIGTRLRVAAHGDENVEVFGFELGVSDLATINAVPLEADLRKTEVVLDKLGGRGNEYRLRAS
ncbi:hypothetical protein DL768_011772 [Monosporascus sp. mg162]|nr:hypothetical protein DL768_011772 [Monosporascus sp. mg162]